MPTRSTSLVRLPLHLLRQTDKEGLDRGELLRQAGLRESDLSDPDARIPLLRFLALWRAVLAILNRPDVGVRFGAEIRVRDVGLVGYLMLNSPTLGDALERVVRFGRILDEDYPPRLVVDGDRAEYRWEPYRQLVIAPERLWDHELAGHLAVIRELVGLDLRPVAVHLPYTDPPRDLSAHRDFFRAPLEFGSDHSGLVFKREHLDLPIRSADATLGRYLEQHAEGVLEELAPDGGLVEKVERALWAEMKEGHLELERVASALAMSPRTLQRRLQSDGTSFSELREEFRRRMATLLLEDRELAVYEVAFLLGYSEPSTFYRAFRRWTDSSPRQFRAASA